MSSYDFLASCYDRLTYDINYAAWAGYIEKHFAKYTLPGRTILDLACGTGSLTRELALRGYEMIGVDQSPEMLAEAAEKNRGISPIEPIFLCQPMEKLDLYGTIDACVCCLDSINYITDPKKLARAFQRVHLFLMPGGLFLFDINSPEKLEGLDGQVFLDETEDAYCVWRSTPGGAISAPTLWISSSWTAEPACGTGERSSTGSGPTPPSNSPACSPKPAFRRSRPSES